MYIHIHAEWKHVFCKFYNKLLVKRWLISYYLFQNRVCRVNNIVHIIMLIFGYNRVFRTFQIRRETPKACMYPKKITIFHESVKASINS